MLEGFPSTHYRIQSEVKSLVHNDLSLTDSVNESSDQENIFSAQFGSQISTILQGFGLEAFKEEKRKREVSFKLILLAPQIE